ncbi:MAG: hypothetical protein K2O85_04500 [Helicobacter sp.]|nr:hypothetical protein [Helicobacter sp.]MDE7317047.1 hypothetical protein [Helicobacter sp.]
MFLNTYTNALTSARITVNGLNKTETTSNVASKDVTNNLPTKLVLGYGVDDDGYFTEDFNKAAGIPEHIKIHSKSMESLVNVHTNNSPEYLWSRMFSEIDIAKTIGNAYKVFSQLVDKETLGKENFTKDEIANLPQGYKFDRTNLEVSKVQKDIFEYHSDSSQAGYKYSDKERQSSLFWTDNRNEANQYKPATDIFAITSEENSFVGSWNAAGEKYTNADGTISMGGILVAMVRNNTHLIEGKATYMGQLQGYDRNVDVEALQAEYYATSKPVFFDYTDQELNAMSEQRREYIKGMQQVQMKIWVVNGSDIPANARGAYYDYMNNNEDSEYFDPISNIFKELDKANKELLERLRKKAIETRQKAQEEAQKQTQGKDVDKLYEESNKAIEEFAKLIEKLQEESNKTKDPKDQWHVSADSIKKAFIHAMNNQNQQAYASTNKQQVGTFEVEA